MQKLETMTGVTLPKKCNWKTTKVSAGWTGLRKGSPLTSVGDSGVERSEVGVGKRLGRFRLINTLFSADDHRGRARDTSTNQ